jgi:hypothetical protein
MVIRGIHSSAGWEMTKSHVESLGSEARQNGVRLGNQSFDFSLQFV